jgi:hypothetical protein
VGLFGWTVFGAVAAAAGSAAAIVFGLVALFKARARTETAAGNDYNAHHTADSSKLSPPPPPPDPNVGAGDEGQAAREPKELASALGNTSTASQDDPTDRRSRESSATFTVIGALLALVAIIGAIVAIFIISHPVRSGTSTIPAWCRPNGPLVLAVSGQQDNPVPALTSCVFAAVTNAAYDGSSVSLVNVDGYPHLVGTVSSVGLYNTSLRREIYIRKISMMVSDIRAHNSHADAIGALTVAGNALQGEFAHGGTIYLEDSGLQEVGK